MRRATPAALAILIVACLSPAAHADEICTRRLNDGKPGKTLEPPIMLSPTAQSAQRQVNFGTDREQKIVRSLSVASEKPLPPWLSADQLNFEALLSRSGDNLESVDFPDPTFSEPRISPDRKTITFSVCLKPGNISAGKYVGGLSVSGPAGLAAGVIGLTVTTKDGTLFWGGLTVALVVAFALLLLKDAAVAFTAAGHEARWGRALLVPLTDLRWWGATLVTVGVAFGTLYAIYANDPSWGATGISAVGALIGAGFGAIGGHAVVTSFSSK